MTLNVSELVISDIFFSLFQDNNNIKKNNFQDEFNLQTHINTSIDVIFFFKY